MECFFLEIKVEYKLSVYDAIVLGYVSAILVIITMTRRTRRRKRSLIQAITSTYIWKNICRIEIFKFNFKPTLFKEVTTGNKWPTQKAVKYTRELDFIQNYVNYFVYTCGCTDSNVRIIYQVNRFFKQINLFKWYFSGPVNLEEKSWPVWKGHLPAWALLGKPTLISINNFAKSLH